MHVISHWSRAQTTPASSTLRVSAVPIIAISHVSDVLTVAMQAMKSLWWRYCTLIAFVVSNFLTAMVVSFYSYNHGTTTKFVWDLPMTVRHELGVEDTVNRDFTMYKQLNRTAMDGLPFIYVITPTHSRYTQKVDLTSLCQTLMHIPNLVWIVIEDAEYKSDMVFKLLQVCFCRVGSAWPSAGVTTVHKPLASLALPAPPTQEVIPTPPPQEAVKESSLYLAFWKRLRPLLVREKPYRFSPFSFTPKIFRLRSAYQSGQEEHVIKVRCFSFIHGFKMYLGHAKLFIDFLLSIPMWAGLRDIRPLRSLVYHVNRPIKFFQSTCIAISDTLSEVHVEDFVF